MSELLTVEETAARLKKTKGTLQSWRSTGKGPAYIKTGYRSVMYYAEDVEAWLKKHRFHSTTDERVNGSKS